jgi:hypothetical protein
VATGITQSYYLRSFIDEIVRTGGAALAGTGPAPTSEALEAEFKQVALAAATGLFGDATPITVELTPEIGDIRLFQNLAVVGTPEDPRRQVALAVVGAAGHDVRVGNTLSVPIFYTGDPDERETIEQTRARLGAVLPLPVHSDELWVRLTAAINAALLRYFPAPVHAADSLGGLLTSGGGWTRGLSARRGDLEIVLERAFFDFYRIRVTGGWVEYGFVVVIRQGGVEVFRGGRGFGLTRLGEGDDAPYLSGPGRGDHEGNIASWTALPTGEAARPAFVAALQAIVDRLAAGGSMNSVVDFEALMVAAIRPPIAGGFWDWTQAALPRLLMKWGHTVECDGTHVLFEISEVYPPGIGLGFGHSAVRVIGLSDNPQVFSNPEGEPLQTGSVGPEALTLRGPESDEQRDLEAIVATYREWLAAHLDHHVANRGLVGIEGHDYFYSFDGYFPLAELLEQRLRWGPPGDPPVPPFDDAALDRAAQRIKPVDAHGEHVLAAFAVSGWTIVLHDDVDGTPFGSYCGISLVPPDGGAPIAVMMVDAWNPEARTVVDGDAFAFRRFTSWLREAIARSGHDEVRTFQGDEDEDEEDEEGESEVDGDEDSEDGDEDSEVDGDEEDEDSEESPGDELTLSDWLLFGLPDVGDRFLVDWRAQWHIVNAVLRVDDLKGIYGFTGEHVERLRTRDVVHWRRFLREVIDPRFARTLGERLVNPA